MNELVADELTEHLKQVISLTPSWSEDMDHLDPYLEASTWALWRQADRNALMLGMELAAGPEHRVEIGGQVIYIWPLRPYGSRAPLALWFEHGWSKSWDWPERDSSATWSWSAW